VEEGAPDAPALARQNTDASANDGGAANGEESVLWYVVQMRRDGRCYRIKIDNLRKVPPHSTNPVVAGLERRRPELNNVNVFEMQTQSKELYKDLDVNDDDSISMVEICGVLGFAPEEVPDPLPDFHPHPERRPSRLDSTKAGRSGDDQRPRDPEDVVELTVGAEIEVYLAAPEIDPPRWVSGKILAVRSGADAFDVEYDVPADGTAGAAHAVGRKDNVSWLAIRPSRIHRSVHSAHERLRKHPMLQVPVPIC